MKDLTQRQKEILNFIAQFIDDNASSPTVREICDNFNISIRAVQDHVAALQKKGFLSITRHKSRSLRVLNDQRPNASKPTVVEIPLIVSAEGPDVLGGDNISGVVYRSSTYYVPGKSYFALRMGDEGLKDAGIFEGDLLVAEKTESFKDGQIGVVLQDRQILVRRLILDGGNVCLKAENQGMQSTTVQSPKILGVLVEMSRAC